jgi:hypothetical protein
MGLTLHYELRSSVRTAAQAVRLVERLREAACDLPFEEVGPITEWEAEAGEREDFPGGMWHATQFLQRGERWSEIHPTRLIAFRIEPAAGSESAEFGLARYPRRAGWSWKSFCKTQYASAPQHGGAANFVRCHVGLVKLLDVAARLGFEVKVVDESDYWTKRDGQGLIREIGRWNELIAGVGGQLKDAQGQRQVSGPIFAFPDFEHLEAREAARRRKGQ